MAATITNPLRAAQPYEESNPADASDGELADYYRELERQELERRQSKGKSRWSRKSYRGVDMRIEELVRARELEIQKRREERERLAVMEAAAEEPRAPTPEPAVPPHWQRRDTLRTPATTPQDPSGPQALKFELHNPLGPRWYMNHHLQPPKTAARPTSHFSPNFPAFPSTPAMTLSASDVKARRHGMTADDPKGSESDTSDSGMDKWKRNTSAGVLVSSPPNGLKPLNRNATVPYSMNSLNSRLAPSPLSKSVSTLAPPEVPPKITRKLSKRNTTGFRSLFGMRSSPEDTQAPLTVSPSNVSLTPSAQSISDMQRPRPVSALDGYVEPKKKRTSVLVKLSKKFSVAKRESNMVVERRPMTLTKPFNSSATQPAHAQSYTSSAHSSDIPRRPTLQDQQSKRSSEGVRRVPPPSIDAPYSGASTPQVESSQNSHMAPSRSTSELAHHAPEPSEGRSSPDPEMNIGNLMIANPDEHFSTSSRTSTPRVPYAPLLENYYSHQAEPSGASSHVEMPLRVANPNAPTPTPEKQQALHERYSAPLQLPMAGPAVAMQTPQVTNDTPKQADPPVSRQGGGEHTRRLADSSFEQRPPSSDESHDLSTIVVDGQRWGVVPVPTRERRKESANGDASAASKHQTGERIVERFRLERLDSSPPPPTPPKNPRRPRAERQMSSESQRRRSPSKTPVQETPQPQGPRPERQKSSESRRQRSPSKTPAPAPEPPVEATRKQTQPAMPRPTSDVPLPEDIGAKEAWEIERMRKGMSVALDAPPLPSRQPETRALLNGEQQASQEQYGRPLSNEASGHGSTHTAFVMQPPFADSAAARAANPLPPPVHEIQFPPPKLRTARKP